MSALGRKLRSHYGGRRGRKVIPELEGVLEPDSRGEPAIYWRPFTLADSDAAIEEINDNNPEGFATIIIRKAENEAGDRLFDIEDRQILIQCVPAHVVTEIGQEIIASVSLEDAKKNSGIAEISRPATA